MPIWTRRRKSWWTEWAIEESCLLKIRERRGYALRESHYIKNWCCLKICWGFGTCRYRYSCVCCSHACWHWARWRELRYWMQYVEALSVAWKKSKDLHCVELWICGSPGVPYLEQTNKKWAVASQVLIWGQWVFGDICNQSVVCDGPWLTGRGHSWKCCRGGWLCL